MYDPQYDKIVVVVVLLIYIDGNSPSKSVYVFYLEPVWGFPRDISVSHGSGHISAVIACLSPAQI